MKKIVLMGLVVCLLSGCGSKTAVVASTAETTEAPESTTQSVKESSTQAPELASIEDEAAEQAQNAKIVSEGDFFDKVTQIYSDVTITRFPDGYGVQINMEEGTPEECATKFLSVSEKIIDSLGNGYKINALELQHGKDFVIMPLTAGETGIQTSEPTGLGDDLVKAVTEAYRASEYFQNHDMINYYGKQYENIQQEYLGEKENTPNDLSHDTVTTFFNGISLAIPSTWTVSEETDTQWFYHPDAFNLLWMQSSDIEDRPSAEQEVFLMESLAEGIKGALNNYKEISSGYVDIGSGTIALRRTFYTDLSNHPLENVLYTFIGSNKMYMFLLSAPKGMILSNELDDLMRTLTID